MGQIGFSNSNKIGTVHFRHQSLLRWYQDTFPHEYRKTSIQGLENKSILFRVKFMTPPHLF